jgi:hypothetical protein
MSLAYAIPGSWYGYVTLDGATAADSTIVDAYIISSIAGTATVGTVQSNGYYLIHVLGNAGDSVSFRIYGNNVTQAAQIWSAGFHHPNFNLTATSTVNGQACPTYSGYTSGTNVANLGCLGGYCVHSLCRAASTYCGDAFCDTGETCSSCSTDCGSCSGGGSGSSSSIITCTENWICSLWLNCTAGTQKRNCTDSKNCGTNVSKPKESLSCKLPAAQAPASAGNITPTPLASASTGNITPTPPAPIPAPSTPPITGLAAAPPKTTIPFEIGFMLIALLTLVTLAIISFINDIKPKKRR